MKKLIVAALAYISAGIAVSVTNLPLTAVFTLGVGVAAVAGCFIFR